MQLNYEEIYEETKEDLQMAERIRRKNLSWSILLMLIVLIAPAWLIYKMATILIYDLNEDVKDWQAVVIALFTIAGIIVIRYFAFRSVQLIFRGKVVPKMIEKIGNGFYYNPTGEIDKQLGDQSKLFPAYNLWDGDDHVKGQLDGDTFEFSSLKLRKGGNSSSSNRTSSSQSTVFKGVFIHIELSQSIPESVWIIPKIRMFGYYFPELKKTDNREEIKIEGLNKRYRLHTTDPVLAKRLFSGHMLLTVNNIIKEFKRKGITNKPLLMAFFSDHICIAFRRKKGVFHLSWFPLFTNLNSPKFIKNQLVIINAALQLKSSFKS